MRLVSLEVKNYRKYSSESADFPDGLIGIVGPNGAGKSSLMEAIGWALYGNPAARTTKEHIKRQGSSLREICQVILNMEIADTHYQIVREMRGAGLSSDAAIHADKKPVARGTQATLEYATRLLGMDREAFFTSFFAKQKELNALSDLQPADRKNLIIRMLGIDDVDKAIELLRQGVRDIDTRTKTLRASLADINALEVELKTKEADKDGLEKKLAAQMGMEKKLSRKYEKLKESFEKEQDKKEKYTNLVQRYTVKKSELTGVRNSLEQHLTEQKSLLQRRSKLKELEPVVIKYERVKRECDNWERIKNQQKLLEELTTHRDALIKTVEQNLSKAKNLEKTVSELEGVESSLEKLEASLLSQQADMEKLKTKKQHLKTSLDNLQGELAKITKHRDEIDELGPESKCPTCFRLLGEDFQAIKNHFEEKIRTNQAKIDQTTAALKRLRRHEESLSKTIAEAKELQKELEGKRSSLRDKNQELKFLKKMVKQNQSEIEQLEGRLKKTEIVPYDEQEHLKLANRLEDLSIKRDEVLKIKAALERLPEVESSISAAKQKIKDVEGELGEIKKAGQKLAFSQGKYEQLQRDYEVGQKEHHQAQLMVKDIQHKCEISSLAIENLNKDIDECREKQKEIEDLTKERQYLDQLKSIFADFRKYLIGGIRPALSQKASELLRELTDGKYSEMELDGDYEVYLYDDGERFSIERFSGGEKDLANLCLRLAISQLMTERSGTDFGFIVLDEIFGSQDSLRKNNIMRALAKLSNRFRQIFLITHVEDIKESMEHVIIVREDESGLSHLSLE